MSDKGCPFRWPSSWDAARDSELLQNTPFETAFGGSAGPVPAGVSVVRGKWPGVRLSARGRGVDAGPTGDPWVDSNGWRVCLERARKPDAQVWVDTAPPKQLIIPGAQPYVTAIADAATCGGRWIVTLDDELAADLVSRKSSALDTWKQMARAAAFFEERSAWSAYQPRGVVAIVSDFTGPNEFRAGEIANLTSRSHQPFHILLKEKFDAAGLRSKLRGLKQAIYPDAQAPSAPLREALLEFARAGGLVVANASWPLPQGAAEPEAHPRYRVMRVGKGRMAVAGAAQNDPYLMANDARVLLSRANDILRLWNGGACGSYLTTAPNGKADLLQLVNYAFRPGRDPVSAWVEGPWRTARLYTLEKPEPQPLSVVPRHGGLEVHMPAMGVYSAIELEV